MLKRLANNFKSAFNQKEILKNFKNNYIKEESTDWITWDNRLGKDIDINVKNLIFGTKLKNISKIINVKKGVYVLVFLIEQSNSVLKRGESIK